MVDSVHNFVADHRQVLQQLEQWQSISPEIKAVLNRTEEKQIKGEDEGVKNWLDDIQDLAYDVDDILDEFAYQQLHLKLQKPQSQASTSNVQKLIPTCCTGATSKGKKPRLQPTSLMDGALDMLVEPMRSKKCLSCSKLTTQMEFASFPSLAWEGWGKTALAQLVYNDPSQGFK
ncbi:hypothetical protein Golob_011759 [Gossypium lobatum]|uniref:Disease resistance N-terminal domain-containing protein n=1 Tax=Gossypium lobatum TaxID=34289 RepID=A0A7J8MQI9_9ROSI|nr:hypothetical protein [Gossypium lobatum]